MNTNSLDVSKIADYGAIGLSTPVEVFLTLSFLSIIPILVVALTTFTRNIIVLSFLRQALGLQQTPPNIVLVALAFFLALFVMTPVINQSYTEGFKPYLDQSASFDSALAKAWAPFQRFLISQTRESDIELMYELSKQELPESEASIEASILIPAFMLSELKTAFQIGFIIFLPFLLIDLVIASLLMSLGMIMVPPVTISLPLKIMLFVVVDGWSLIARTLVSSVV